MTTRKEVLARAADLAWSAETFEMMRQPLLAMVASTWAKVYEDAAVIMEQRAQHSPLEDLGISPEDIIVKGHPDEDSRLTLAEARRQLDQA